MKLLNGAEEARRTAAGLIVSFTGLSDQRLLISSVTAQNKRPLDVESSFFVSTRVASAAFTPGVAAKA